VEELQAVKAVVCNLIQKEAFSG